MSPAQSASSLDVTTQAVSEYGFLSGELGSWQGCQVLVRGLRLRQASYGAQGWQRDHKSLPLGPRVGSSQDRSPDLEGSDRP